MTRKRDRNSSHIKQNPKTLTVRECNLLKTRRWFKEAQQSLQSMYKNIKNKFDFYKVNYGPVDK